MNHFQWIVALTRIISAVFRKGGDVTFLVKEMKVVFDPRGGYCKACGVYMPTIFARIGADIEQHMGVIGLCPRSLLRGVPHGYDERRQKDLIGVAAQVVAIKEEWTTL